MTAGRQAAIERLRRLETVREQAWGVLARAERDGSQHFVLNPDALASAAQALADHVATVYGGGLPPLRTVWHALRRDHADALDQLAQAVQHLEGRERARCGLDLAVLAALLDPSGGAPPPFLTLCRAYAEGRLAAATGASSPRLEADGLARWLKAEAPPPDEAGPRHRVLAALVEILARDRLLFGPAGRFGLLLDTLLTEHRDRRVAVSGVAEHLAPFVTRLHGEAAGSTSVRNLGDVWRLPGLGSDRMLGDHVPFHALLQALLIAMAEPLSEAGLAFDDETRLGIPATRGLARHVLRLGLLRPRHLAVGRIEHPPGSDIVVELRALALALAERLCDRGREILGATARDLPDVRLLVPVEELAANATEARAPSVAIAPALF